MEKLDYCDEGANALTVFYKEDAIQLIFDEVMETLLSRRVYGTDNIMMFHQKGVLVRLFDKLQRLRQLIWEGRANTDKSEKTKDTIIDVIGYGVIWRLLDEDYWLLPWRADMVVDEDEPKIKGAIVYDHTKKET